jgi:alpha-amylase
MEAWSLPPRAAARLAGLERDVGERLAGPDGALIRGAHWKNFLVKYPESNRMHKKTQALSTLCRARGNPAAPRRAIGRAQCNDAYWHGVFGGLYLPHLRAAIWRNLAAAERELRAGEPLAVDRLDVDGDGFEELWIHSGKFSALVSPRRGGAIEEYTLFDTGINYANALTRRREAYHELAPSPPPDPTTSEEPASGTPSIHDIEKGVRFERLPPADADERALFVDRVLPGPLLLEGYSRGEYEPHASWARTPFAVEVQRSRGGVELVCRPEEKERAGMHGLAEKRLRFTARGECTVTYRWDPAAFPAGALFAPEISLAHPLEIRYTPVADVWSFPIATVSKSERGLDETVQWQSLTPRWSVALGKGRIEVTPG